MDIALIKQLTATARDELTRDFGMSIAVDFGDDFWNALFYGTLKTFTDRVDSSGFCHTSYGEEHNVKSYGRTHYPRDTAEAARALADCGFVDIARRIIEFTLNHIPKGQYYVPHVYNADGSVHANTIQIDTPAHIAHAIKRCLELTGPTESLRCLWDRLDKVMTETWAHHFHADLNLLDAGNYNEQGFGGSSEPICDLFTNASMVSAMRAMTWMAERFGETAKIATYRDHATCLAKGLSSTLYDSARKTYYVKHDLNTGRKTNEIHWMSLYAARWYPDNPQAWEYAFEFLRERTTLKWDRWNVITSYADKHVVGGKKFAWTLAYLARTGRFSALSEHLDFCRGTIRRPVNIYPEQWLYSYPNPMVEFHKWFFSYFKDVWTPYSENPEGDYTIDSGNCEQAAVFLIHLLEDLLGVKWEEGHLHLWPKLPFDFPNVRVEKIPVIQTEASMARISYEQIRQPGSLNIHIRWEEMALPMKITLAMPLTTGKMQTKVNGQVVSPVLKTCNDVIWVSLDAEQCSWDQSHACQIEITLH
jgi:hypothetical protein